MTISSETRTAGPFIGTGSPASYPFAFKIFAATDLTGGVIQTDTNGNDSTLVLNTDYSVALNADQNNNPGGTLTYLANSGILPLNYKLTLTSNVSNYQTMLLTNLGGFLPTVINDALDRCVILLQQILNKVNRSIKIPLSDGTSLNTQLPGAAARLGKTILFDAVTGAVGVSLYNPDTQQAAAAASAAAALASQTAAATSATNAAASATSASTSATNASNSAAAINIRWCGTAGGAANALTLTPGQALASYTGAHLFFVVNVANTTEAVQANVSSLGNQNIKQNARGTKTNLAIGQFQPGMMVELQYDGTDLIVCDADYDLKGSDVAAAATVALASQTGNFANLTGAGGPVTAITGLATGDRYLIRHTGVHTLTHSATLFLLNNAQNITTAAGDISEWVSDGTNVYMTRYMRASGQPLTSVSVALGQCQLQLSSSTQLVLVPKGGNVVTFPNGSIYTVPSSGLLTGSVAGGCRLDGVGSSTLAATTKYYVYLWYNSGTPVLDFSTTGHSTDATTGIEIKTGDNTRVLVGMCYTQAGPTVADSLANRLVASWFNPNTKAFSNSFTVNRTTTSASLVELNSEIRCQFLTWGDAYNVCYNGAFQSSSGNVQYSNVAITLDGVATIIAQAPNPFPSNAESYTVSPNAWNTGLTEGFHYFTLAGSEAGGFTLTAIGGQTGYQLSGSVRI